MCLLNSPNHEYTPDLLNKALLKHTDKVEEDLKNIESQTV